MNIFAKYANKHVDDTALIENLSHDGRGISKINGKATFIQDALPGETVDFFYTRRRKNFDEGLAVNIENPSPIRKTPKCQHFNECGGCQIQHIEADAQLKAKEKIVLELFEKFANTSPNQVLEPIKSPQFGYRHKARLSARYVHKKEELLLGFREKYQSRYVADVKTCHNLHPAIGEKLSELKALIMSLSLKADIPQLEIAIGDTDVAIIIRHNGQLTSDDLSQLEHYANAHSVQFFSQTKGINTIKKIVPEDGNEVSLSYELPSHNLTLFFHPSDFTQVNPFVNRQLVDRVIELLEPKDTDTVIDYFCGLGNFSLATAKYVKHVTGFELSKNMVKRAYYNAKANHIDNVDFKVLDLIDGNADIKAIPKANKIIIDPPRTGADKLVKELIGDTVKEIVYISCDPATLARDAQHLVHEKGFTLEKVFVIDMFPNTHHIESCAVFVRN